MRRQPDQAETRAYDMSKRGAAVQGTRRRIAEAALALFAERDFEQITLTEVARVAGVSHQTVLNHFESKAGLIPAAGAVFSERVQELQVDTVPGDIGSVIHVTCTRYEALGDINAKYASLADRMPELKPDVGDARRRFLTWLDEMLDGLLPREPGERRRVLLGVYAALEVNTWKLFRRDLGLTAKQTEQQLTDLVLGVLARRRP